MGIKSPVDVRKDAVLQRQRFPAAFRLPFHRVFEGKVFSATFRLHVPGRKRALEWISQDQNPFHLWVVTPNSIGGGVPIHVNRARFADDAMLRLRSEMRVIFFVIGATAEFLFVIEEMQLR